MTRRALIAGNWKMNGLSADLGWAQDVCAGLPHPLPGDVVVCPPATLLFPFKVALKDSVVEMGAQDCSCFKGGAFTGDLSATMLKDIGCRYVIVGHSERREGHGESDANVRTKAEAALSAGLIPIICLGETLEQRESGKAEAIVTQQLRHSVPQVHGADVVIAYEPIWAIGTGKTATAQDAQALHAALRAAWPYEGAEALRILYGGSVKPDNAQDLLAQKDIDGALVGGASLNAQDFLDIIKHIA
ncbi:triose-phosphate isomerase [Woodsholea maritima]|uniref:triose-phosphate isomerase n=1 Tax=Woodsholea maritima TaxID=240237 RepID=UPI000380CDC5|nr:triose-phosphate isomerase [Woodsholea maritima]